MKTLYYKLIFLCALSLAIGTSTFAQTRFGVTGGLNIAGLKYIPKNLDDNATVNAKAIGSFRVGVVMDYSATQFMSLQSGIIFTGVGANVKRKNDNGNSSYRMHPWYLKIPVNLLFRPKLGYSSRFYFGAGPYIAFGLGGKGEYNGPSGSIDYYSDHKLKFGNGSNKDIRMIDLGMNILAGVEFNQSLMLGAQYGLGLRNLAPEKNDEAPGILKNRVFSITLTILLGHNSARQY